MPGNSAFCRDCKRSLDRLKSIALSQGDEAVKFLSQQRQDAHQVHKLLAAYHQKCPPPKEGKRAVRGQSSAASFSLVTYKEEIKTSTSVLNDNIVRLMWRGVYVEHMMSAAGGYKSRIGSWNHRV